MFTGRSFLFSFSLFSLLLLHLLVVLIVLLQLLEHTQVSLEARAAAGPGRSLCYLDRLREALDGQVEPDAELQGEEVLPVGSLHGSRRTTAP